MNKDNQGLLFLGLLGLLGIGLFFLLTRKPQTQASHWTEATTEPEPTELEWQPQPRLTSPTPVININPTPKMDHGQVVYQNTEEWEIVTDPGTGDIKKIIVHRTATRSK